MSQNFRRVFSGRYSDVREICQLIEDAAQSAGFNEKACFQIALACDEACANIIEHAYGGQGKGEIEVAWGVAAGRFHIIFRDNGSPFDPGAVPLPNPELPLDDEQTVGGWGLQIIRQVMDEMDFHFDDAGNSLTLTKYLPER